MQCRLAMNFFQNYYVNPRLNKVYTADQYGLSLVGSFTRFVKDLYGLGARKLGVTSLPPLGCLPAAITLFGFHKPGCVSGINADVQKFNKRIDSASKALQKQLPGLKVVIFDIYKPLYDIVNSPSNYGFKEARRGCCRTGRVGATVFLCNPTTLAGTCPNATEWKEESVTFSCLLEHKVSQFTTRVAHLNEAFSVVRRVPILRPTMPAAGVNPWPAMILR
ncbi:GDSL esterase/lipase APG [Tripterygium wilfordii]|uniref:GDSL esterase/lipase APG n=1 Tax=Tripterygium wilfordii TaxID=458696 RepID=A0A7J7CXN9_TRIWF|nr:GDSL esterase/lipase APG [Tripterygium wilfordii]